MSDKIPDYENMQFLDGIDHVRLRPGMYFGGTDQRALHNLVWEVLENAVDQAHRGLCNRIVVTLNDDHKISISDNGTGIPVELYKDSGQSVIELVMTETGGKGYDAQIRLFRGGSFGVGLAAVNALSEECEVQVKRDGYLWQQRYAQGRKQSALEKLRELAPDEQSGTMITFKPDFSIIELNEFDSNLLHQRLRELAMLLHGTRICFADRRSTKKVLAVEFFYPDGVTEYVRHLNHDIHILHSPVAARNTVTLKSKDKSSTYEMGLEIAFQFTAVPQPMMLCFMNTQEIEVSGVVIDGFINALDRVINAKAHQAGLVALGRYNFLEGDIVCGLTAVVNIWHPTPSWESTIRWKLVNAEVEMPIFESTYRTFDAFAEQHPDEMRRIVEKCLANKAQREQRRYGR